MQCIDDKFNIAFSVFISIWWHTHSGKWFWCRVSSGIKPTISRLQVRCFNTEHQRLATPPFQVMFHRSNTSILIGANIWLKHGLDNGQFSKVAIMIVSNISCFNFYLQVSLNPKIVIDFDNYTLLNWNLYCFKYLKFLCKKFTKRLSFYCTVISIKGVR